MNNLLISVDRLEDIQICPRLYNYKHNMRVTPVEKANYLEAGDLMHFMLRMYYENKLPGIKIIASREKIIELARNYASEKLSLKAEEVEETVTDFSMYCNYYDETCSWIVEGVEEPFARELFVEGDFRVVLIGKSDLRVVTNRGRGVRAIIDHKYEEQFREKRDRANQPLAYCWAFDIKDFMYNRIGKQKSYKPKDRLARPYFSYAQFQIDDWLESAIDSAKDIVRHAQEDHWPSKFTACTFHGNRCTFYNLCNTPPAMKEYKLNDLFKSREPHNLMEGSK